VAYGGVIVGNGITSDRRRLILPAQRPSRVRRKRPHERHTASARHHAPQNRSRHRHGRPRWRFAPAPPPVFLLRADPHGVSRQPAAFLPARGCPRRLEPQRGSRPFRIPHRRRSGSGETSGLFEVTTSPSMLELVDPRIERRHDKPWPSSWPRHRPGRRYGAVAARARGTGGGPLQPDRGHGCEAGHDPPHRRCGGARVRGGHS
jgi:hypothetical protein